MITIAGLQGQRRRRAAGQLVGGSVVSGNGQVIGQRRVVSQCVPLRERAIRSPVETALQCVATQRQRVDHAAEVGDRVAVHGERTHALIAVLVAELQAFGERPVFSGEMPNNRYPLGSRAASTRPSRS